MVSVDEFIKDGGMWVFRYALAQLSFKRGMYLVVYHYECEFVNEIKPNHGDCVFSYDEVFEAVHINRTKRNGVRDEKF